MRSRTRGSIGRLIRVDVRSGSLRRPASSARLRSASTARTRGRTERVAPGRLVQKMFASAGTNSGSKTRHLATGFILFREGLIGAASCGGLRQRIRAQVGGLQLELLFMLRDASSSDFPQPRRHGAIDRVTQNEKLTFANASARCTPCSSTVPARCLVRGRLVTKGLSTRAAVDPAASNNKKNSRSPTSVAGGLCVRSQVERAAIRRLGWISRGVAGPREEQLL